jgi:hypothetical protein
MKKTEVPDGLWQKKTPTRNTGRGFRILEFIEYSYIDEKSLLQGNTLK